MVELSSENEATLHLLNDPGHVSNIITTVVDALHEKGYTVDGVNIWALENDNSKLDRIQFYLIKKAKQDNP